MFDSDIHNHHVCGKSIITHTASRLVLSCHMTFIDVVFMAPASFLCVADLGPMSKTSQRDTNGS